MRNKRKGVLMASAILGSAAIVSTGFAAWVITAPSTEVANGNIQVDSVTDNRTVITPNWDGDKNTVIFGRPSTVDSSAWLTNKGGAEQDLDLTLKPVVALKNPSQSDLTTNDLNGTITATITPSAAMDAQYVKLPTFEASYTVTAGVCEDIAVNFSWGTHFGAESTNPYDFYKTKSPNDFVSGDSGPTWADDAYTALSTIEGYASITFKITLTFTF